MRDAFRFGLFEDRGWCWLEIAGTEPRKTCPADAAQEARDTFTRALREARDGLGPGGGRTDLKGAHSFLSRINSAGIATLQTLFGDEYDRLKAYLAPIAKAAQSGAFERRDFPVVQVEMPRNFIQIEALPFVGIGEMPRFTSPDEMVQAARRFFGFCFVTQRLEFAEVDPDTRLRAAPKVPVKMFRHANLAGSAAEERMLARFYALEGGAAWPGKGACTEAEAIRAMVRYDLDFAGGTKAMVDQIHHFSCHSDLGEHHPYLEMMGAGGDPIRVATNRFNEQFRIAVQSQETPPTRPLGFLNACESNSPSRECLGTWASTLTQARYRAVIGTEAPAPDKFASAFSRAFYGQLLAGRSVGQALQRARWNMLERWKNPFGLLYTLFGNPELRIG